MSTPELLFQQHVADFLEREHGYERLGKDAAIVGSVHEDPHHFVQMTTAFGGKRIVDWLSGEQLPRIC